MPEMNWQWLLTSLCPQSKLILRHTSCRTVQNYEDKTDAGGVRKEEDEMLSMFYEMCLFHHIHTLTYFVHKLSLLISSLGALLQTHVQLFVQGQIE